LTAFDRQATLARVPKLTHDLLLQVLRDAGGTPLGLREILARTGLNPGARTAVKRALRELVRAHSITGEGKRYALRTDRPGRPVAPASSPEKPAPVLAKGASSPSSRPGSGPLALS